MTTPFLKIFITLQDVKFKLTRGQSNLLQSKGEKVSVTSAETDISSNVYVVVQFYPWFKFSFLLFQTHYHVIIIHYHTQKQKKRKLEPRIKLSHNIYFLV